MSVRSAHGFVPPLQFIEIMSFTSMLVVSSSIVGEDECSQKYAIKSNVPWPVSIEWRCSSKNIDQDRMLYSLWIWLLLWFIYRIYSIFDKSIFWMKRASKKKTHKHWTVFLFHFHELNILFTFRYFIAHMLDTTFVTFIVGVFFFFSCFILFMISWAFQRLTMTKHEWTNQSDYQWFLCCTISVLNSAMEFGFLQRDLIRDTIVAVFEVDD